MSDIQGTGGGLLQIVRGRASRRSVLVLSLGIAAILLVSSPGSAMAGTHWAPQTLPANTSVQAIEFLDSEHGWIQGFPYSYRTTDGGATWTGQDSDTTIALSSLMASDWGVPAGTYAVCPERVSFVDALNGWGIGGSAGPYYSSVSSSCLLWRTTDGGAHWTKIWEFDRESDAYQMDIGFFDHNNGWVVTGPWARVHTTSNGGVSWTQSGYAHGHAYMLDALHGWSGALLSFVGASQGYVASTSDGGQTWVNHLLPITPADDIGAPRFFNQLQGIVTGQEYAGMGDSAFIARTNDGGQTWSQAYANSLAHVGDPVVAGATVAWVRVKWDGSFGFGPDHWLKTVDGGATWAQVGFNGDQTLGAQIAEMDFVDSAEGWAVSKDGSVLLHTTDGGDPALFPVYRFYNPRLGTHFYTVDEAEKENVLATLCSLGIFKYEGIAYYTNPLASTHPLYRFYNKKTGTHLYTADEGEKNTILNTLSATYSLDGVAYNVSMTSGTQVHRFFSPSKGVHFYSSDPAEIANVRATLGHIWQYEGPAYYLGQ